MPTYVFIAKTADLPNHLVIAVSAFEPRFDLQQLRNAFDIRDLELLYQAEFSGSAYGFDYTGLGSTQRDILRLVVDEVGFFNRDIEKYRTSLGKHIFRIDLDDALQLLRPHVSNAIDFYRGGTHLAGQLTAAGRRLQEQEQNRRLGAQLRAEVERLEQQWREALTSARHEVAAARSATSNYGLLDGLFGEASDTAG